MYMTHCHLSLLYNIRKHPVRNEQNTVELSSNVMKGTKYFVSLKENVAATKECNVTVNREELLPRNT